MAKSKMLKLLSKFSAAALSILAFTSVSTTAVKADNPAPKELTQVITGVELLDASDTKQNVTPEGDYAVRTGNAYKLRVTFDLKQYNENLNNGDYFTFDIPAPMTVYGNSIDLMDPITKVNIGQVIVTPNGNDQGGKAKITLKNLDKYLAATGGNKIKDISGDFAASFRFLKDQNKTPISFNSSSMKQEVTHTYTSKTITGPKVGTENYAKSGGQASRGEWTSAKLAAIGSVSKGDAFSNWRVRVNTEKQDFGQNIVLHDTIPNDDTSYTPAQYIPESLKIYKADITGGTSAVPPGATLMVEGTDYTVAWNSNYTSFDVTLKDGTVSYFVTYSTTTPNDGTKVANIAALSLADGTKLAQNTSRPGALSMKAEATSLISGTIVAATAYQIKINKTDAFTLSPVPGAVYTVTAADDASETTEVTTNEKGVALTKAYDQKWEGKTFKIKEKTAPAGYELDKNEYTVKLGAAGSTINLKDEPIPAVFKITAKKVVEGRADKLPKADEFTFNLFTKDNLKDPVATAKSKADGTITFENLRVKGAGTYNYIIKEDTSKAIDGITFDEMRMISRACTGILEHEDREKLNGTKYAKRVFEIIDRFGGLHINWYLKEGKLWMRSTYDGSERSFDIRTDKFDVDINPILDRFPEFIKNSLYNDPSMENLPECSLFASGYVVNPMTDPEEVRAMIGNYKRMSRNDRINHRLDIIQRYLRANKAMNRDRVDFLQNLMQNYEEFGAGGKIGDNILYEGNEPIICNNMEELIEKLTTIEGVWRMLCIAEKTRKERLARLYLEDAIMEQDIPINSKYYKPVKPKPVPGAEKKYEYDEDDIKRMQNGLPPKNIKLEFIPTSKQERDRLLDHHLYYAQKQKGTIFDKNGKLLPELHFITNFYHDGFFDNMKAGRLTKEDSLY